MCVNNIRKCNRKFVYGIRTLISGAYNNVSAKYSSDPYCIFNSFEIRIPTVSLEKGKTYIAKDYSGGEACYYGYHCYPLLTKNRGYINDFNEALKAFKKALTKKYKPESWCLVKLYDELTGDRYQMAGHKMKVYKV